MDAYADTGQHFDPESQQATNVPEQYKTPQAEDDSQRSNLRKAWDVWTSHPENNAALLQFGINMMSGRGLAGSLGGAAEASAGNVAAQQAEKQQAEEMNLKEQEAAARTTTAKAYADQVRQGRSGGTSIADRIKLATVQNQFKVSNLAQAKYQDWLHNGPKGVIDPSDPAADETLKMIQAQFPDVKSRADIQRNPRAASYAQSLFLPGARAEVAGADTGDTTGAPQGGGPAAPAAPAGAPIVRYNAQGQGVRWNPQTRQWEPL